MGKKKSGGHGGEETKQESKARAFVLKVAMHCSCNGCIDKIRAAVRDMTLLQGIESWDQSALETKGELKLVATTDPQKLRQRLHKATRKNVDLVFFPGKANKDGGGGSNSKGGNNNQAPGNGRSTDAAAARAQAMLLNTLLQQQGQYGQNAWGNQNQLLPGAGAGWNTPGEYAYAPPWAVQQLPDPYADTYSYPAATGGAWGGYAYPPAQYHGY